MDRPTSGTLQVLVLVLRNPCWPLSNARSLRRSIKSSSKGVNEYLGAKKVCKNMPLFSEGIMEEISGSFTLWYYLNYFTMTPDMTCVSHCHCPRATMIGRFWNITTALCAITEIISHRSQIRNQPQISYPHPTLFVSASKGKKVSVTCGVVWQHPLDFQAQRLVSKPWQVSPS